MIWKKTSKSELPEMQEKTAPQYRSGVAGFVGGLVGGIRPPAGTFETYRRMRGNPTIALGRIAATAPIRVANWSVEGSGGVDRQHVRFVEQQMRTIWSALIKDVLYALDYGFQGFEKVFEVRDGNVVYRKLKPLCPDMTEILIDQTTGAFAGVRQGNVSLSPQKCFLFTCDGEGGNFYGRSRHENLREHAWYPWIELSQKRNRYFNKVAGVVPVIEYPEGQSEDATGAIKSNFDLARAVLENLGEGKGVAMPNVYARYAGDLARSGVDMQQLKAWHISFLETNQRHGGEFTETMRHLESLMLRGWLVPERAVTEGQYGTKAEAGEHAKLALSVADLLLEDIIRCANWYVVNPLLVLNFGRQAENSIRLVRAGLDAAQQSFFRGIVEKVLTAPANVELLREMLDLDSMLSAVGLPKAQDREESTNVTPNPRF